MASRTGAVQTSAWTPLFDPEPVRASRVVDQYAFCVNEIPIEVLATWRELFHVVSSTLAYGTPNQNLGGTSAAVASIELFPDGSFGLIDLELVAGSVWDARYNTPQQVVYATHFTGGSASMSSIDASDPTNLTLLDNILTGSSFNSEVRPLSATAVAVASSQYVTTVDVSDPSNLAIADQTTDYASGSTPYFDVDGSTGYLLWDTSPVLLTALDMSDPSDINELWTESYSGSTPGGISTPGDGYAYFLRGNDFNIVDLASPSSPIGSVTLAEFVSGCTIVGDRAYATFLSACTSNGVSLINLTDRTNPTIVATLIDNTDLYLVEDAVHADLGAGLLYTNLGSVALECA